MTDRDAFIVSLMRGGLNKHYAKEQTALFAAQVRREALEEAERACLAIAHRPSNVVLGVAEDCASAIRAIRERGNG